MRPSDFAVQNRARVSLLKSEISLLCLVFPVIAVRARHAPLAQLSTPIQIATLQSSDESHGSTDCGDRRGSMWGALEIQRKGREKLFADAESAMQ
jgi:Spy/CpxP family protein refolding chaperone